MVLAAILLGIAIGLAFGMLGGGSVLAIPVLVTAVAAYLLVADALLGASPSG